MTLFNRLSELVYNGSSKESIEILKYNTFTDKELTSLLLIIIVNSKHKSMLLYDIIKRLIKKIDTELVEEAIREVGPISIKDYETDYILGQLNNLRINKFNIF